MSGKSLVDQIKHYQKDIERCPDNSERMIRCIQRLYVLPIKVEHLQETGVGRSVNSLRKYKGDVGEAAKALVAKWKAMVAAEESGDETTPQKQEVKAPPPRPLAVSPVPVKTEQKIDRHSSKEKSASRNDSSNHKKHHSESKSHNSDSKSLKSDSKSLKSDSKSLKSDSKSLKSDSKSHISSSKSHEKLSNKSYSSDKKSHNSSSNHFSEKKDGSPKNHKSNHDKKRKSDSDESPPHKKHKKHHSHSKNHQSSSKKKEHIKSESEEELSSSGESEVSAAENTQNSNSEREVDEESNHSNSSVESDSSSSSDHRHRSKHKSSHHTSSSSSHSKNHTKYKEIKEKSREKDKYKEHNHSKSTKHSSSKSNSSPDYNELIKENEKKVKKEKDDFVVPKPVPSIKNIKIETNEDGSIDSESGASFADALLGMDNSYSEPKKKKKTTSSSVSNSSSSSIKKSSKSHSSQSSSSSHKNSEGSSRKSLSSLSKPKTIDELVEPPELLSKKVKLEALDLDISSTLPEINLNYKPLPPVPENCRRPANKAMTEEEMFTIMTTKNQRTKVYSGNKVYQSTVPSLFNLCIQLLYDNIDAVEYTGGVPYNLLKPLLQKLNADQLYVLEHFNPYLIEDTDELWKFHCNKDFRNQKRQDLETWRELYLRCLEEREKKLQALTANITQSMAKSTPVRQAKLAYVDSVVKPPRNVARKQAKYGTGSANSSSKNPAKQEIISKAVVGGNTPGVSAKDVVPTPPREARAAAHHPTPTIMKKKKAPLMQKALQVMKGTRYKR